MTIQSSYSLEPAGAVAGMLADGGDHDIVSGMSASRKLMSVAVTASNDKVYTITINGTPFVYTADGSATTAEIVLGLKALINAGSEPVLASGVDTPLLIESTIDGPEGDFTYSDSVDSVGTLVETLLVAQGEQIPFAFAVCLDERATDDVDDLDFAVRLPRQSTDITGGRHLGVALWDLAREARVAATFRGNTMVPVLRKGRCWVKVEEAVTRGGDVYVRYASGGDGIGAFGAAAGSSERALWPRATYLTTAGVGELAVVELNA